MAQQGLATPTYAYANNNPLHYTDPTGLCIGPLAAVCVYLGLEAGAVGLAELAELAVTTAAIGASTCIGTQCLGPTSPGSRMPPNIPSGAQGGTGSGGAGGGSGSCAAFKPDRVPFPEIPTPKNCELYWVDVFEACTKAEPWNVSGCIAIADAAKKVCVSQVN